MLCLHSRYHPTSLSLSLSCAQDSSFQFRGIYSKNMYTDFDICLITQYVIDSFCFELSSTHNSNRKLLRRESNKKYFKKYRGNRVICPFEYSILSLSSAFIRRKKKVPWVFFGIQDDGISLICVLLLRQPAYSCHRRIYLLFPLWKISGHHHQINTIPFGSRMKYMSAKIAESLFVRCSHCVTYFYLFTSFVE